MSASANAPASGVAITAASADDLIQHLRDWRRQVDLVLEGRVIGTLWIGLFDKPSGDIVMEGRVVGRISQGEAGEAPDSGLPRLQQPMAADSPDESAVPPGGHRDQRQLLGLTASGAPLWSDDDPKPVATPSLPAPDWIPSFGGGEDYAGYLVREQLLDEALAAAATAGAAIKDFLLPNIDKALDHPQGNQAIQAWGALEEAYNIALGTIQSGVWIAAHATPWTPEAVVDPKSGAQSIANRADVDAKKFNGWLEHLKATIQPGDAAVGATAADVVNDLLLAKNALRLGTAGLEALSKALVRELPEALPEAAGIRPVPRPEAPEPAPPVAPQPPQAEPKATPDGGERIEGPAGRPVGAGAPNRGMIFVGETLGKARSSAMKAAHDFEAATEGAYCDITTQQRQVPALRYDNPNPKGAPYVKFDGYRRLENGKTELIDAKTRIVPFETADGPYISKGIKEGLSRQSRALEQNPGYVGVIELPTEAAANEARLVLSKLKIRNISVRVRPPS